MTILPTSTSYFSLDTTNNIRNSYCLTKTVADLVHPSQPSTPPRSPTNPTPPSHLLPYFSADHARTFYYATHNNINGSSCAHVTERHSQNFPSFTWCCVCIVSPYRSLPPFFNARVFPHRGAEWDQELGYNFV